MKRASSVHKHLSSWKFICPLSEDRQTEGKCALLKCGWSVDKIKSLYYQCLSSPPSILFPPFYLDCLVFQWVLLAQLTKALSV